MSENTKTLALAAGLGIIAGMRSMSALALLSHRFAQRHVRRRGRVVHLLAARPTAGILKLCAAGEMVADKTPYVPSRIEPPSVAGRALMGALSGFAVAEWRGGSPLAGALVGSAAAVGSTFMAYEVRRRAGQRSGVPDPVLGLIEDVIVLAAGSRCAAAVV